MILLDSDHFSALFRRYEFEPHPLKERLRLAEDTDQGLPIVVVEESFRGWTALIGKQRTFREQLAGYRKLAEFDKILRSWQVLEADEAAVAPFERLRAQKIRMGTQDLKIAAIALANDALLLTANTRDFGRVPGLRHADWLVA